MRNSRCYRHRNRSRESGFAMLAMLTVFALISSYLVASGLSRTQAEVNIERNRRTLESLQEAKAALIAYVATDASTGSSVTDQPGSLPCPASDDYGVQSTCLATAASRIGRLPWKTLGSGELRDSSGQILWYALSANFRKASGTTVINSDTQGTLTITGNTPAQNIVAVIIAPGAALSTQDRTVNSIGNFLERANAAGTDIFVTDQASDTFNDRLIYVTQADLMSVVEPAVAARIERDIKPYIDEYFYVDASNRGWNAFPFPARFSSATYSAGPGTSGTTTNRSQSNYVGDITQSSGLLPLYSPTSYSWTSNSGNVSITGSESITSFSCSASGSNWRCNFTISALNSTTTCGSTTNRYCIRAPTFHASGRVSSNAGLTFADLPSASSVTLTVRSGSHSSCSATQAARVISGALSNNGVGTVTYDGTLSMNSYQSSAFSCNLRVTIPTVTVHAVTSNADAGSGWFIKNEWYRQTYYAVSPGYLPGGGSSCVAGSTCLTVNNLPSSYASNNDKRAILIFAGRALTGSRPSATLANYLEGENQTPSDFIFTHRFGSASTLNDRAIVLSP